MSPGFWPTGRTFPTSQASNPVAWSSLGHAFTRARPGSGLLSMILLQLLPLRSVTLTPLRHVLFYLLAVLPTYTRTRHDPRNASCPTVRCETCCATVSDSEWSKSPRMPPCVPVHSQSAEADLADKKVEEARSTTREVSESTCVCLRPQAERKMKACV